MQLVIDAGNTAIKLTVFDDKQIVEQKPSSSDSLLDDVRSLMEQFPAVDTAIISSVSLISTEDIETLSHILPLHQLSWESKLPFTNRYASPETLGADRLALAAAAVLHYPEKNVLVIDAGTCVTYDFVSAAGEYLGGAISPGLQMRYKALNNYTSRLPLLHPEEVTNIIGDTTSSSIHSGIVNGLGREIEGVIEQYESRYEFLTVILTGGDAQFLSKSLKKAIFAHSNFLPEGLNFLLEYNKR